jgi:hypothetical protein
MRMKMSALCFSLAAIAALAGQSGAQTVGPDVIVGDLPDVTNYGTAGGFAYYAVGTTSCNVGDQVLTWIANTNQHPVISQNMYQLVNGRLQQIGQAWLKHGFCALQGSVCGSCTPNPSGCPALGVGCSDPYSSGLNGTQSGLGPKAEVNAATGAFPYPWVNNGNATGNGKRLRAAITDLAAGGQFFVSSMYVQPEDAQWGNSNNNSSYRRVTIAADRSMSLVGVTQRARSPIYAWQDHGLGANTPDPSVNIFPVDVPGDGRFNVASKVTDNGNGTWRYEYAVENFNSDRSGRSFTIPVPAGAVVTNIGFHDVDYHSGEPYAGTDWTSSSNGTSVAWTTVAYATNPNANALRWDTIYNFWFDCNVPPAGSQGTIGLFKPGTPSSVAATVVGPSPDGQAHPLNDSCALAPTIGGGDIAFNTTGASTDGPDEPGACVIDNDTQCANDIWYRFTATCDGVHTVTTCGSTFDTKLFVYNAACPTGSGQSIACNDDSGGAGGCGNLQSSLTFTATQGQSYLIRIGGFAGATGAGTVRVISPNCGPVPPANDDCANAAWIAAGAAQTGSTALATNDGTANCGSSASSPDVWFKYRPATSGTVTVITCGSNYDTVVSAHSGNCGALTQLACNDDDNTCASNGLASRITFNGVAGTTYRIRVSGYANGTGNYSILVTGGGGVIPPANDDCSGRAGVGTGTLAFNTTGATTDGIAHAACNQNGVNQITNDIWYNHPAQATGRVRISTCGSNFNTRLAVYRDAGCTNYEARLMACNDNLGGACGTGSQAIISVVAGTNYTIRIGGTSGASGAGTLTIEYLPACTADFNGDGFLDFFDFDDFVTAFQSGLPRADFNSDGFVDFFDFDDFVTAFENGCD